jgi:hypothetical protein
MIDIVTVIGNTHINFRTIQVRSEVTKPSVAIYRSIAARCLVDGSRFLISIKIYFPPYCDQEPFINQKIWVNIALRRSQIKKFKSKYQSRDQ